MRPDLDDYFLGIARAVAARSTCLRRAVGCVLVDEGGRILSTGYNGVASGAPHCNAERIVHHCLSSEVTYPNACPGARSPSGSDLDRCDAVHAEQNALVQCRDVDAIYTVYVTTAPCVSCVKLFLNTDACRVVFAEPYAGAGESLWTARRGESTWIHVGSTEETS